MIAQLLAPASTWDYLRLLDVLLLGVLVGMTAEILYRYWNLYHRPPRSATVGHVSAMASSYLIFVVSLIYAHLFQVGRHSAVEEITVPACLVASVVGIIGLYRMLRHLSGKSDRRGP